MTKAQLSSDLQKRLHAVVRRLTSDCLDWYRDDVETLAQLSEADLESVVLAFLSHRDFYRETPGTYQQQEQTT